MLQGPLWVVSSTFYILDTVQILVHTHFDLIRWLLVLKETDLISETVAQMAVELISVQKRDSCESYILFHVKNTKDNIEMMLK